MCMFSPPYSTCRKFRHEACVLYVLVYYRILSWSINELFFPNSVYLSKKNPSLKRHWQVIFSLSIEKKLSLLFHFRPRASNCTVRSNLMWCKVCIRYFPVKILYNLASIFLHSKILHSSIYFAVILDIYARLYNCVSPDTYLVDIAECRADTVVLTMESDHLVSGPGSRAVSPPPLSSHWISGTP
jgi:hypothetical protein